MNKLLLIAATLSVMSGCAIQNQTVEHMEGKPEYFLQDGSLLVKIDHFEVEKGTVVALMNYVDNKDRLCFQWVSSAKKIQDESTNTLSVATTISMHCGNYEVREEKILPFSNLPQKRYVPVDLKAVNEYRNADGLLVQAIVI
ncbi:hypothetical protein [Vibrio alginolyticus]|uniref:hypothetical protein n=1 Tax=Vibrio alginolyticus TaxID=663 RepID=UPI0015945B21|nr:hypothetical protein [Vibrio alginolyticus]QKS98444.1 hypothetical protein HUO05_24900 [Vibrio alginolyticus]